MDIVLRKDVDNLGKMGEIVKVKDGYARNYLIPQSLAYPATDSYIAIVNEQLKVERRKFDKVKDTAEQIAEAVKDKTFTTKMKAGEDGKLFGSVTSADIVELLAGESIIIEKKKLVVADAIKSLGEHVVKYKLHPEVDIQIKVVVEAEEEASAE